MADVVGYNKRYKVTTLRMWRNGRDELELVFDGKDILLYVNGKYDSVISNQKYGPYSTLTEALETTVGKRTHGMTVGILNGSSVVEYWFETGIEDADLVLKNAGSSSNVTPDDKDLFDPLHPDGYKEGDIVSYINESSPDERFNTLNLWIAQFDIVPVNGITPNPEQSQLWLFQGQEIIQGNGATSITAVTTPTDLRNLSNISNGDTVDVLSVNKKYRFYSSSELHPMANLSLYYLRVVHTSWIL